MDDLGVKNTIFGNTDHILLCSMFGPMALYLKWVDSWVLMAEILHQLRLVVYHIIYRGSYIPGGARFQPSTVSCEFGNLPKMSGEVSNVWMVPYRWTCRQGDL